MYILQSHDLIYQLLFVAFVLYKNFDTKESSNKGSDYGDRHKKHYSYTEVNYINFACFLYFRVYLCKVWSELRIFNDHTAMATGVRFGANGAYLASTSMDRTLKIYGP